MKNIDENGFWEIKNNPISRVGVFPYLGKQISEELEPDKIYYVYRPAEELFSEETLKSFNAAPVPLVDDHTMIGKGFTPAEKKGIHGVISNIRKDGDNLIGDLAIYSEDMKQKISEGKKDLSMGYFCSYDLTPGTYNGIEYDAIQRDLRSNHVALVDEGRCGSSVRVYDAFCFDAKDFEIKDDGESSSVNNKEKIKMAEEIEKKDEVVKDDVVDKRELIREIGAIAGEAGLSEELVRTLMQKAEMLAYNASEETKADDACKDEKEEVKDEDDEEEKEEKNIEEIVERKVQDALDALDITGILEAKQEMIAKVRPLVGDSNYSKMTNKEIAKYACDKLNIKASKETAQDVLDCYLKIKGTTKIFSSMDSESNADNTDEIIAQYLKGE